MKDNASAFDCAEYDRKIRQTLPYYEEYYRQVIGLVGTVFSRPVSWLDIGCGTGEMGRVALASLPLERFVFMDSSEAMIEVARERLPGPGAEFSLCDIRNLQAKGEFDVVTAIQVFHYLQKEERREALRRSYEALKEGGIFVSFENIAPCTEAGTRISLKRWERYQVGQGKSPEEARAHIGRYGKGYFPIPLEEHLNVMRECGFPVVEVLWLSYMQAGFWGRKGARE